nr:MAG TPA: putative protease [Caudoviricetes sp.]
MAEETMGANNNMTGNEPGTNPDLNNPTPPTEPPANPNGEGNHSVLGGDNTPPTEPTVYDFKDIFPEDTELDETVSADFSKLLNQVGATQEQAVELAKFGSQYAQNILTAYQEQQEQAIIEQHQSDYENAKKELGGKFDETVALAGKGIEALTKAVPELRQYLVDSHIDNNINMIKVFAAVGEMVQEDPGVGNSKGNHDITTEQQLAESIYGNMKK